MFMLSFIERHVVLEMINVVAEPVSLSVIEEDMLHMVGQEAADVH